MPLRQIFACDADCDGAVAGLDGLNVLRCLQATRNSVGRRPHVPSFSAGPLEAKAWPGTNPHIPLYYLTMDYGPMKHMLMSIVPFDRHMGLEILDIGPGTASVRLPESRRAGRRFLTRPKRVGGARGSMR